MGLKRNIGWENLVQIGVPQLLFFSYCFSCYFAFKINNLKNQGLLKFIAVLMVLGGLSIIWFGLQAMES